MAETSVGFWEKNSFNNTGFIFKGQKFHRISVFGFYDFPCYEPSGKCYFFIDELWQVLCFDSAMLPYDVFEQDNGVAGT